MFHEIDFSCCNAREGDTVNKYSHFEKGKKENIILYISRVCTNKYATRRNNHTRYIEDCHYANSRYGEGLRSRTFCRSLICAVRKKILVSVDRNSDRRAHPESNLNCIFVEAAFPSAGSVHLGHNTRRCMDRDRVTTIVKQIMSAWLKIKHTTYDSKWDKSARKEYQSWDPNANWNAVICYV